jgi:ribosomal protein S18 acetylase RimI-like enzyme
VTRLLVRHPCRAPTSVPKLRHPFVLLAPGRCHGQPEPPDLPAARRAGCRPRTGLPDHPRGPWDEADQRDRHARSFCASAQDFILVEGREQGLRALEWRPTHLYLARLYLRAEAQGRGIGAAVVRDLLSQARALGRGVELQVLKVNAGAQRFYGRLGFERVGERPEYWLLRAN